MHPLIEATHKTEEFFWRSLSKEVFEQEGILAFATGMTNPYHNPVLAPSFREQMLAHLPAIEDFYQKRNLPWVWVVNSSDHSPAIRDLFQKHGLTSLCQSTVMIYRFSQELPEGFLNIDVQEITEEQRLVDWALPLLEGFQSTEAEISDYMKIHQRAHQKDPASFHHFVTYVDAIPVAAATLSVSPHGARIDDVATRTAYLRQGFGTAVTIYAMKEAKKLGYAWCCLDSSEDALPLYQKIGFTKFHTNEIYGRKTDT
jgi:GNAT superfamily N-acetyltransferase